MEAWQAIKAFEAKYRSGIHYVLSWAILVLILLD